MLAQRITIIKKHNSHRQHSVFLLKLIVTSLAGVKKKVKPPQNYRLELLGRPDL
jgi:hypothetical protein